MSVTYGTAKGSLEARATLSSFVRTEATQVAGRLGFGWVGVTDGAPSTYQQLRGAYQRSKQTGEPLPVSSAFCEDTVFMEPEDNVAFRFWHDTSHVLHGLSFSLEDEWELVIHHLHRLEAATGLGPETPEYRLLRDDLMGQLILLGIAKRFPLNQGEFTRTCASLGWEAGILAELRRVS